MSERVQDFLLKNTKGLQYLVNERLAKRPGLIGRIFKNLEIGKREYSVHSFYRVWKVINYVMVQSFHALAVMRPIGSRFFT